MVLVLSFVVLHSESVIGMKPLNLQLHIDNSQISIISTMLFH